MDKIRNFTFLRLAFLALLATVVSTSLLSAQDVRGTFTLPFEAKWGQATLPAGDYEFKLHTASPPYIAVVSGTDGRSFIMAQTVTDRDASGDNALILVRRGKSGTVRALRLSNASPGKPNAGLVFQYAAPKGERQLLAQGPVLIQRIPVLVSGK